MGYKTIVVDMEGSDFIEQIQRLVDSIEQRKSVVMMDCCGGPWEYPIESTPVPTERVSQCCKARVFSEGDRWVCETCRLGTKPIVRTGEAS